MKPLRVLHIIESLGRGGAERQLVNLLLAHDRKIIRPSVITLSPPLHLAEELRAAGIAVMTLNLPGFRDIPLATLRLIGIIKLMRPDMVHTWLSRADLCGRIAARIGGHIPVVSAIQAPIYAPSMYMDNPYQKRWKLEIVRILDRWSGRLAQATYVGCSHDVVRSTGAALAIPKSRLRVIYNSVNPVSARIQPRGQKIITVGRLLPQKGHTYLIAAIPTVLAHHPQATLSIVGDGPLRSQLEQQVIDLKIGHAVKFLGIRHDVPDLLANSNIFAFPSLWEGMPLALLEALTYKLPIVATDIPPICEIIDGGIQGLLVPDQDAQALAEALLVLLNNPAQQEKIGLAGYKRVHERFNIRVTVNQWERLYQTLASQ